MECCQYFLEGNIFSSIIGRALCGLTENTVSSEQRNEEKCAFQLEGNNGLIFMGVQIELIRKSLCSSPNAAKIKADHIKFQTLIAVQVMDLGMFNHFGKNEKSGQMHV